MFFFKIWNFRFFDHLILQNLQNNDQVWGQKILVWLSTILLAGYSVCDLEL